MAISFFQVMTCLGVQMMILAVVLNSLNLLEAKFNLQNFRLGRSEGFLSFGFQQTCLTILGIICFVVTSVVIHHYQGPSPGTLPYPGEDARTFRENLMRFAIVPGKFGEAEAENAYPIIPWLAL